MSAQRSTGWNRSGKSKALIDDLLSLYDNTEGPTILIIPKNDDMAQNYMQAHARRFGTIDLEENVVHFPIPDVLPGFSLFDLELTIKGGSLIRLRIGFPCLPEKQSDV